ncbi:TonB-dependent receptor [Croceicoccus sp. F390]|uniref:TonB-dependent receptor n=1 Tax=Croceicoccus esteveae TaxID=3075597 RepID=A0ABU2ZL63_9SPHN|nr:TonB-dependent receptor [Croceicoccus sp. F390]MDT0577126.1 TonB-dependent receptor [Croceicoccus sp. F390]
MVQSALLITSATIFTAVPAWAQDNTVQPTPPNEQGRDPTPVQSGGVEEIIVTARKTAENLQDTPVSITAFSESFLENQNIQQVDKIAQFTPNLVISKQPSSLTSASILIRGIGQIEPSAVAEPGVGMYLDGVYIARTAGAILDLVDLERIEVLRGPQGTLFGRNTIGGAIQLISRRPTDELGVDAKVGYGSFDTWYAKGTLNTGYIAGTPFKATVSYQHRESGGWVDNKLTDKDPYGLNTDAVWIRVRGDISDAFSMDYSFDWNKREGQSPYFQLVAATPNVATYLGRSESLGGDPLIFSRERLRDGLQEGFTDRKGEFRWDSRVKALGHALTLDYEVGDFLNLKSISAYREFNQDTILGLSGNGNLRGIVFDPSSPTLTSVQRVTTYQGNNAPQDQRQYSQELQATGNIDDFSYILGAYYFDEKASERNQQFLTIITPVADLGNVGFQPEFVGAIQALNPGLDLIGINAFPLSLFGGTAKSTALFGQVSWRPSTLEEKLELTGGLRYTWDKKTLFLDTDGDGTPDVEGRRKFKNLSWLASANYDFTDDLMAYVRAASGYKSGGFNPRAATLNGFDSEKVIAYEAGIKADWFDRRLRTNLSVYRTNYDDLQINQFSSGSSGSVALVLNAGRARIQGIEFEATAVPVERLTLNASFGYTDPKYKEFLFRDPVTDVVINVADEARFANVNKWNWTAGAQYAFAPFEFGELLAQMNYSYRSEIIFHPLDRINIFNKEVASPGHGTLSARLTLSDIAVGDRTTADVSLWGENLADNDSIIYGIDFGGLGFGGAYFAEPRSFGIDVRLHY